MADNQKDQKTEEVKTEEARSEEVSMTSKEDSGAKQAPSEPSGEASSALRSSEPTKTDEPTKPAPKPVSANLEKIIEQIEKLSVLELADLVHALEERFGVSAVPPVMTAGPAAASAGTTEPQEEKTTFNVILSSSGANKIAVIKAVRELVQTLGLKEAKDLVEGAPKPVLESVNKQTAEEAKTKLTAVGATVELQ